MEKFPNEFIIMQNLRKLGRKPIAYSTINGSAEYKDIKGFLIFSNANSGTWIDIEVKGLPPYAPAREGEQPIGPFGFHIHEGEECTPMDDSAFTNAKGHYNPYHQPHGNHAGDFPVLFSNHGTSYMSFYTNQFALEQIIGRTVVIHLNPDDYRTEPAGNSGKRIACGVIIKA